ncbi:MAG: nucleoside hydrolase [Candidatus Thorarchaeota archaeon]
MTRLLIDTDIGSDIDDALALLFALNLEDVEILGITTSYGPTDLRAKIAWKIVKAAGRDIPIAAGQEEPLGSIIPVWISGTEGRGVLTQEEIETPLHEFGISDDSTDLILDCIEGSSDPVKLVVLGALTNIAKAFSEQPEIVGSIEELVFMGGGLTYPDPIPETIESDRYYQARHSHNVLCDIEAARQIIRTDMPIRVVTNDVTCQYWLEGDPIRKFKSTEKEHTAIVGRMLDVWLKYRSDMFDTVVTGTCPHDPLTVAVACNLIEYRGARGDLTIDEIASTEFRLNDSSNIELILGETGNKFAALLNRVLHR